MSSLLSALSIEGWDGGQVPLILDGYRGVTQVEGLRGLRARTSVRPAAGRHGSTPATRFRDDLPITITGHILDEPGSDPARVWMEWDTVKAALTAGVDTDRLLQWTAGDQQLQATVRVEDLSDPVQVGPLRLAYQATLRNPAGVAFSQKLVTVQAASPELSGGGGMTMPATFPVTFLPLSSGLATVTNEGGAPTPPTLILQGFMRDPIVVSGDRRHVIQGDIAAGDELWLNAEDRSVLLNGDPLVDRRSMRRSAQSRWFDIPPGVPTLVRLQVSEFDSGAGLQVRFRHAH